MATIPASAIVQVNPEVISAGGNSLAMIALVLTTNTRVPIGSIVSLPSALSVSGYFGPSANETSIGNDYFAGFLNSSVKPGAILFAQYPQTAVAAYLRGGNAGAYTLAQIQAISGSINVIVDGMTRSNASLNLSSAVSYSSAASIIQTALNATSITATCSAGAISGTTLTVSGSITGTFYVGMAITGTGVAAGTVITAYVTGSGGAGTYTVNVASTTSTELITGTSVPVVVTYDSVSGGFVITSGNTGTISTIAYATGTAAASLLLTSGTGAVLSQGAAATTPSAFMAGIVAQTTNFASFMTAFNPDSINGGNSVKQAFATWNGQQNNEFVYVCWDTDVNPTLSTSATTSLGYLLQQSNTSGTCLIWEPSDLGHAAFICGSIGSINFNQTNGRITFDFKAQSGISPAVTSQTVASNLLANGYNYVGAYATAGQGFTFFNNGSISGEFLWLDAYVNQIWLNAAFQLALMELLTSAYSVPYDTLGYSLIRSACMGPINAGLNFGMFSGGVQLSPLQIAEVNTAAGTPIDSVLSANGWYLQIVPATAAIRAARTSPVINFWYLDAGSVQQITLASIEVM